MVRGIEVGVRSLKGYLCYKYFEGREEEGEEEFKRAEGIDRWSSVVLRRRMECWVMVRDEIFREKSMRERWCAVKIC